jgi:hypothetical protein|tara:strand:+ start:203 stop:637 length:435 start_codon:yes stop_codon:yes gene_type:complete
MGNTQSINKINFEDMQYFIKNTNEHIIINTLPENQQSCLIINTVDPINEVKVINKHINNKNLKIIIYGLNCNDNTIHEKYNSLYNLGFTNLYLYTGGMFEWLCLQDIYGSEHFPTTTEETDILKFKAKPHLERRIINNLLQDRY